MKKRILITLIAVCTMLIAFGIINASADTYGELYYDIIDGKAIVAECDKNIKGELVIPDTFEGYPVTSIGEGAFNDCTGLTSVTIPDSVTSIETCAFIGCRGLTSITIPDSVIWIKNSAFYNCASLTSVTIPNNVISIGNNAFENCTNISSITIGDRVTNIGEGAFKNCKGLTSVTIPLRVTSIGYEVFSECNNLKDVYYSGTEEEWNSISIDDGNQPLTDATIHCNESSDSPDYLTYTIANGEVTITYCDTSISGELVIPGVINGYPVTSIGNDAFYNCTGLTSVTIGDSVTSIGDWAFSSCTSLTSITIPNSVTSIGYWAFSGCESLTSITIPNSITSIGDCAFDGCESLTNVTIGDSVTTIGNYAFNNCTGLTSITIPDSVTSIGDWAFQWCESLTSITIPNSVTSIGDEAFYNCTGLNSIDVDSSNKNYSSLNGNLYNKDKTILIQYAIGKSSASFEIPNSVISIGNSAFSYCAGLTSVTIPNSITSIGDWAFSGCESLTSITIPNSITSIGDWAFYWCTGLTDIYYSGTEEEWNKISIGSNNTPLTNATIHYNYSDSPDYLTYTISNGEVTINSCNTSISGELVIPATLEGYPVTRIGNSAFYECTGLTSITIPNSVTSIGAWAFLGCTGLERVNISDIASWCNISFADYDSNPLCYAEKLYLNGNLVTELIIPDSVTRIGNSAFAGCTGLTSVTIGNSVTRIGNSAFIECTGLTSITIPDSVTWIDDYAFYNCNNLTDVYYNGTEEEWNNISIGSYNTPLTNATIHCNKSSDSPDYLTYTIANGEVTITDCDTSISGELVIPATLEGYPVTTIGKYAFEDCTSLTSITIPDSVTTIGESAFDYCDGLTSITIGDSVTTIGFGAFSYCESLTSITIPDSVTWIDDYAFDGCNNLTDVYYNGTEEEWNKISIGSYNTPLTDATIHFVKAEKEEYHINEITIKDMSGNALQEIPKGTFLATVSFTNVSSSEDTVIILAQYTEAGAFKGLMYVQTEDVPTGSTMKLSIPVDNTKGDIAQLKAFCWESFGSVAPLGNSVSFPAK